MCWRLGPQRHTTERGLVAVSMGFENPGAAQATTLWHISFHRHHLWLSTNRLSVTRYSPRKWVYIKRDIGGHDPAPFSLTAVCKPESLDEVLCCETSPIHSCHMGLSSEPWPCSQSLVLGSELSSESPPCCCLSVCPSMALKTLLINSSIPSNLS